jgi:uncharacterized protein YoxC
VEVLLGLDVFVELARGALFVALAVAFLVLAWMFLRLASEQVVPLLGKTHVTVDNINSQLSQLDTAVGDVTDITGELDQTTAVITRGVRGGVIKFSSATAGLSKGISAFFGSKDRMEDQTENHTVAEGPAVSDRTMEPEDAAVPLEEEERF